MARQTFTKEQADSAGFKPLTVGYYLPQEQRQLNGVLSDLDRGGIEACLVETPEGVEVWRKGKQ